VFRLLWVTSARYLNKHHVGIYTVAGFCSVIHSLCLTLCDVNMKRDIVIYSKRKKRISLYGISVNCVCRNTVFADVTPEDGSKRVEVVKGVIN
jgi:hypothetical protein